MEMVLTELCTYLNNWFARDQKRVYGDIAIEDGGITNDDFLEEIQTNQYFRIVGSVFNDGVYKYDDTLELIDEEFDGAIWLMAIPKEVLKIADDIAKWQAQYEAIDSPNMSPYNSESFGGYSYSKASGTGSNGASGNSWQGVFGSKLSNWRKKK